jgi:hypothetical protein
MPFIIRSDNAPTLIVANGTSDGFLLATMATIGVRLYRLTMNFNDKTGSQVESHYYFKGDFSSFVVGKPLVIKLPFKKALFVNDTSQAFTSISNNFEDLFSLQTTKGDSYSGVVFKLYILNNADTFPGEQNAVPLQSNLDATYTIGTQQYRFIYYRQVAGVSFFTGVFGDKAFRNEYSDLVPLSQVDQTQLIDVKLIAGINYFFIKTNFTPNVIISNGVSLPTTQIVDSYEDDNYLYTMKSNSPNVFANGKATINVTVVSKATSKPVVISQLKSDNSSLIPHESIPNADGSLNVSSLFMTPLPGPIKARFFA